MPHFRQGLIAAYWRDDYGAYALILNAELFGGCVGQVHFSFAGESAPVIDAHDDGTIILGIGDFGVGQERQCLVRGGHGVHVEFLTAGGSFAMKVGAVPRDHAALGFS